jgi:putative serine protease PepD
MDRHAHPPAGWRCCGRADGRVIGVNTSIATHGGQRSGDLGIGFAIPIGCAVDVAEDLLN